MKFNFLLPQLIILILLANFISCGTQESNVLDINPSPPEVAKTQSEISENTQSYDKVQPEKKAINSIDNTKLEKSDEEIASDLENSMIILEFGNDSDNEVRTFKSHEE